ncbi:MAG: glycoside hydrolase family 5 protein [Melioribacteraceae bacterium]|nr:glycoside hydrolase family 5 protein [Melioribacteraceae bacterium]
MRNGLLIILLLMITTFTIISRADNFNEKNPTNTIVEKYGILKVDGNKIVDKNGEAVSLIGMSLFWSQWGGEFYNQSCIEWLVKDWKCTVIRAAMGIEGGGYLTNPERELEKIFTVIDACINLGVYVIVDWHDHNGEKHAEEAVKFFGLIAQKYGEYNNIIYEIYNEPLQVSWSNVVKPYSVRVISEIRKYDKDKLIIAGTPSWSQDVDSASTDLIDDKNTAYSLHYYSSTHRQFLRDKAIAAMNNGAALFVSEYGISEANGNGIIDLVETDLWFKFIEEYKLSALNWSIMDKDETSSALKPGTYPHGNWKEEDLTESGKIIRDYIRNRNAEIWKSLSE